MKSNIYQLALKCKAISDNKMKIKDGLYQCQNIIYIDLTVKGAVDEYKIISELQFAVAGKHDWCDGREIRIRQQ